MQNTTQTTPKAKKLARRLLRENRHGRSYRTIVKEDYDNKFSHAVLVRIANTGGEWLPKDESILIALGLKRERKPGAVKALMPISEMATAHLRRALIERKEMPPVHPAIIREFQRLGWTKKEKRARTR
jgi:hypothetical protein